MAEIENSTVDASKVISEKLESIEIDEHRGSPVSVDSGKHSPGVSPEKDAAAADISANVNTANIGVIGRGLTGSIKWFSYNKGFGFIVSDDGNKKDCFFHNSSIIPRSLSTPFLREGDLVEFDLVVGTQGRLEAAVVSGPGGKKISRHRPFNRTFSKDRPIYVTEQNKTRKNPKYDPNNEDSNPEKKTDAGEKQKGGKRRPGSRNTSGGRRRKDTYGANDKNDAKEVKKPENEVVIG